MLPAAFLAPVIHEWVKALVSTALGDPTPTDTGHLTLNPFRFFEPIGFMFILLFGYGWGNPVPTSALHYRNRQSGVILTYTIPVLANLFLGMVAVVGANVMISRLGSGGLNAGAFMLLFSLPSLMPIAEGASHLYNISIYMLVHFGVISISLALFNLIPIYPMAANKLLLTFSRPENIARFNHYEKPMQVILILGLAFGLISRILWPITARIIGFTLGIA